MTSPEPPEPTRAGHRLPRRTHPTPSPTPERHDDATQVAPQGTRTRQGSGAHAATPADGGDVVGHFRILDKIGEGGMGVVYRALDTRRSDGREVAVKVLRPHIAYDPDARTRLAREVATLERVHTPGVAAVIAAEPYGERPYIATEYVPGIPLDEVVKRRGPFEPDALARLGRDLAVAIQAIHDAGVVHRDLKPGNVLMVDGRPVVIDFGIAHIADDARLTSTGLVMGTPGYLSPELVEGAPVSTSTDWWGWAATLAFAAQGEPPFGRGPMPAVLDRVTRGQANLGGVDARLRPLLAAALSPVPQERPSARQVIEQMERYARGEPTTYVPVRRAAEPRVTRPESQQPRPDATAVLGRPDATRVAPVTSPPPLSAGPTDAERAQQGAPVRQGTQGYANPSPYGSAPVPFAPKPQSRPGEHDPRINLPHRSGTLQAIFVLWLGVTALVPVVGLVLLVVWNLAARFSDSTITQTVLRRYEAGRRRSDGAVAVASAPWHALRATLSTLFALILPTVVFACVAALVGIGWVAVRGGVPRVWWALPLVLGAGAAQLALWRGAGSVGYRRGSRSLVRGLVPQNATRIVAGIAVGLGLFMLVGSFLQQGDISWFPLTGGIDDPLARYAPSVQR